LKINIANVPNGNYALEVYKVGYRSNDAYSTYLSMGKPSQLTQQQVEQIIMQNDGSPMLKEIITVENEMTFSKQLDIRENDVFFLNLVKL
jgi:xylan 1,4-beta-xylosidase